MPRSRWLLLLSLTVVFALGGCARIARSVVCDDSSFALSNLDYCCPSCVTEQELARQLRESRRRDLGPPRPAATEAASRGRLRVNTGFVGGRLVVVGQPDRHPTRVLLAVRPVATLRAAPCSARIFRDAAPLVVHHLSRASDHEARLAVDLRALRDLDQSRRFAGEVCGRRFELDDEGRKALALFEVRFRERLASRAAAHTEDPLAAGSAPADEAGERGRTEPPR